MASDARTSRWCCSPRGPVVSRRLGLRPPGPAARQPWLRRAAGQLPGITGFGKEFIHAAEQEFAGRMHDDLIDAVSWPSPRASQTRPHRDPRWLLRRLRHAGRGHLHPGPLRGGGQLRGPSSLVTLIRSFPAYWRAFLASSWFRFVGDPDDPDCAHCLCCVPFARQNH